MEKQKTDQRSFIFILLILAVAAVVYFLVWNASNDVSGADDLTKESRGPVIESSNVIDFDKELDQELKSFDNDLSDLDKLESDAGLNNADSDLNSLSF